MKMSFISALSMVVLNWVLSSIYFFSAIIRAAKESIGSAGVILAIFRAAIRLRSLLRERDAR